MTMNRKIKPDNISVIIRSKNEERWVGHCIQSVLDQIITPEIILIDNDSKDRTIEIAKHFQKDPELAESDSYTNIKILNIEDYTPGKAINLGAKNAEHENILVISSHCVLKKISLEKHLKDLEKYVGIFGHQTPIWEGKKIKKRYLWSHFTQKEEVNMYSEMEGRYFFHNAVSFFKTNVLLENPFDEYLRGKEDRYWANDIVAAGKEFLYDPNLDVDHHYTENGNTWKGIG